MTKKLKKQKCKEILNSYNLSEKVNKKDKLFLIDVFKNHPNWEEKRGLGGKSIIVNRDSFGHRCFYIKRIDNSIESISYHSAIRGESKSNIDIIKTACRNTIHSEIVSFSKNNVVLNKTKCVISGEILTKENINIDHYDLTFIEMFNIWFSNKKESEVINKIEKVGQIYQFKDLIFAEEFIKFHNDNCKLRAVTKYINQIVLKR